MLSPDNLAASGTEHGHQRALFAWAALSRFYGLGYPTPHACEKNGSEGSQNAPEGHACSAPAGPECLDWLHAIHNQGSGDAVRGARAKAEGVKAGVPDVFLPHAVGTWHGLYIELKKPNLKPKRNGKGAASAKQLEFGEYAQRAGYGFVVCYGWREAAEVIASYINWGIENA